MFTIDALHACILIEKSTLFQNPVAQLFRPAFILSSCIAADRAA